jgi:hypothetical protein
MIIKTRLIQTITGILIMAFVFVGVFIFSGCSDDDAVELPDHQVHEIVIFPDSAFFEVGQQVEFSAFALTAAGDTVDTSDLDIEWEWWSTDPDVFTVEDDGTATGQSSGDALCVIEATILRGTQNFTGRDSAFVFIF